MAYWLMKTEPSVYGIDDLASQKDQTDHWDGIRNYQVRNMMRDDMKVGDAVFIYHSNCKEPGIVGLAKIVKEAYTDFTAFDSKSKYYDPKSDPDNPRWLMVDIKLQRKFKRTIGLNELRQHSALEEMLILRRGNRLSVTPLTKQQWEYINKLE